MSAKYSSENDFATQIFSHKVTTIWRNGGATSADFRDNTNFTGVVEYTLNGQEVRTISKSVLPTPQQTFDDMDAFMFLNETKGKYIDILSLLQRMHAESNGDISGTLAPIKRTQREIPYVNTTHEIEIAVPQIDYTMIEVKLFFGSYNTGFSTLKKMADTLNEFPHMIITSITFNLESEEVSMAMQFIHESEALNTQTSKSGNK
jgi:hypothetical protein